MRVLFDDTVRVHYRQLYVESRESGTRGPSDPTEAFGMHNGMCGADIPGFLFLRTGKHSGYIALRIERHDTEPRPDDVWEDIVEASFRPATATVQLMQWAGERRWPLELEQQHYRVRYHAYGMDFSEEGFDEPEEPDEHYLLQFWPARPEPDRVVRQQSRTAGQCNTDMPWSPRRGRDSES
ncbi:hypothetical protein ACQP2P_21535 [Dactylosporangium sp. CA-139114]|uniref:hypothetical protein n=1 Tax=Dactylosporangium sp. CA-139114 TaxID=3239931 RepID=UPI003D98B82E